MLETPKDLWGAYFKGKIRKKCKIVVVTKNKTKQWQHFTKLTKPRLWKTAMLKAFPFKAFGKICFSYFDILNLVELSTSRTEDTSVTAEIFDRPRRNTEKPPIFGPKIKGGLRKFALCMVRSRSDLLTCTFVFVTLSLLMTCAYFIIIESTTMKHQV